MLSFAGKVNPVQRVKGNIMQMLAFIDTDLFPGGKTIWERPAVDCEANTAEDGYMGVVRVPESGGKGVWVAKRRRGRSHSDRGKSGFSDIKGWGEILSRGE